MRTVLGIDAGGTATRAVLCTLDGVVLGRGAAGPGNPVARGADLALAAMRQALHAALRDTDPHRVAMVLAGIAGGSALDDPAVADRYAGCLRAAGLRCGWRTVGDAVTAFAAGSPAPSGAVLIAGTGAVAARIVDGTVAAVADGLGWLLGDEGSGFWLGRAAVRSTVHHLRAGQPCGPLARSVLDAMLGDQPAAGTEPADGAIDDQATPGAEPAGGTIDGQAPPSAEPAGGTIDGQAPPSAEAAGGAVGLATALVMAAHRAGPGLSALAPLVAAAHAAGDPAAAAIVAEAGDLLYATLSAIDLGDLPIVLAGGVLGAASPVTAHLQQRLAGTLGRTATIAGDPATAAAWLALVATTGADRATAAATHAAMLPPAER